MNLSFAKAGILSGTFYVQAAVLFATALVGRVWCGFACPQTVYTSMSS